MAVLQLVQGDTNPRANFTITYQNGEALDLTGANVKFVFRKQGSGSYLFKRACAVPSGSAASGECYYDWQSGDLENPGSYLGELEVTLPDGKVQTISSPISFDVREQLG